jgi:hypothetical protein
MTPSDLELERVIADAAVDFLTVEKIDCIQTMDTSKRSNKAVSVDVQIGAAADHTKNENGVKYHDIYNFNLTISVFTTRAEKYNQPNGQREHYETVGKIRYMFGRRLNEMNTRLTNHAIQFIQPEQSNFNIADGVDQTDLTWAGQIQIF